MIPHYVHKSQPQIFSFSEINPPTNLTLNVFNEILSRLDYFQKKLLYFIEFCTRHVRHIGDWKIAI